MPLLLFGPASKLLSPAPQPARVAFLHPRPFAHRGLHGDGVIENSLSAFRRAIAAGYGIELDVQTSRDGEVFVFHDTELDRLTGEIARVDELSGRELEQIRLSGTNETIPRLSDVLNLVDGQVPILIEIKAPYVSAGGRCLAVRRALEGYRGNVGVMSFNPDVGRWFHEHAARIPRGLVVTEQGATALPDRSRQAIKRYVSLFRAKPDFLAYDIRDLPSAFAKAQRGRGLPVLTWTVRSDGDRRTAAEFADQVIFEQPDAAAS